jgi:PIN domain nuclease of toxin-antitoxin system
MTAGTLPWDHRDPFDRVIAAQSMIESAPLVTADEKLAGLPGLHTIW